MFLLELMIVTLGLLGTNTITEGPGPLSRGDAGVCEIRDGEPICVISINKSIIDDPSPF